MQTFWNRKEYSVWKELKEDQYVWQFVKGVVQNKIFNIGRFQITNVRSYEVTHKYSRRPLKDFKQGRDLIQFVPPLGSYERLSPSSWLPVAPVQPLCDVSWALQAVFLHKLPFKTPQVWLPPSGPTHCLFTPEAIQLALSTALSPCPATTTTPANLLPFDLSVLKQGTVCHKCQGIHVSLSSLSDSWSYRTLAWRKRGKTLQPPTRNTYWNPYSWNSNLWWISFSIETKGGWSANVNKSKFWPLPLQ